MSWGWRKREGKRGVGGGGGRPGVSVVRSNGSNKESLALFVLSAALYIA